MGFRINSTGRRRIHREHIRIRVFDQGPGLPQIFSADVDLPVEMKLDPAARVYVEPYVKSSSMRFEFGTVGALVQPEDRVLADIDAGTTVLFRVKVVDETGEVGRILASANGIRPESDSDGDDRKPLLPVRSANLGEEIWRLEVDRDAGPELIVNSRVPDLISALKRDPILQGVIYPELVRRLVHEVYKEENDPEEEEWIEDWRLWFAAQVGREFAEDEGSDPESRQALADEVASAFADKNRFATNLVAAQQAAIRSDS
jgi:hypothetical protein